MWNIPLVKRIPSRFTVTLLLGLATAVLLLLGSLFSVPIKAYVPDAQVSNLTELLDAVSDAPSTAPGNTTSYVIELESDIELTGTLQIDTGKNILLTGDYTLSGADGEIVINVKGILTLDGIIVTHANGATGNSRGILVNAGELYMYSGAISENAANGNSGGGVYVGDNAKFEISGTARITDNFASDDAGGVFVSWGATFTMSEQACISGNTALRHGGGVYVSDARFNIQGGVISGNKGTFGGGIFSNGGTIVMDGGIIGGTVAADANVATQFGAAGGGVYNYGGGSFTLNDGSIIGNSARNAYGGGIYNDEHNSELIMTGGEISNNYAYYSGGGVYNSSVFTMSGGEIVGNTADNGNGGGVMNGGPRNTYYGTFTMENGVISGNKASAGGGVFVSTNYEFIMEAGSISDNQAVGIGSGSVAGRGGGVFVYAESLTRSYVETNPQSVTNPQGGPAPFSYWDLDRTVRSPRGPQTNEELVRRSRSPRGIRSYTDGFFEMKGGEISGNSAVSDGGGVYNRGSFILWDGMISANTAVNGGGVGNYEATFIMESGTISGNTAASDNGGSNGGGVYNYGYGGEFTMKAGTISDNTAGGGGSYGSGGGVSNTWVIFNMEGGTISGNIATSDVGGGSGGGVYHYWRTSFTMTNGMIIGNTAGWYGGGVCLVSAPFLMNCGDISNNSTSYYGGGVYVDNLASFDISGDALISENEAYHGGGVYVTASGTLDMTGGEISNNTATNDGGGVYTVAYANFTTAGSGIVFANNKAQAAFLLVNPSSDYTTYTANIQHSPGVWTEPFEYGYNNYDINYTTGDPVLVVTFDANGGNFADSSTTKTITVPPGSTVGALMPVNPAWAGYNYIEWNTAADGSGSEFTGATAVNASITVYAQWEALRYTVVVNASAAGVGNSGAGQYVQGTVVTIRAGTRAGYTFNGWTVNMGGVVLAGFNNATTTFSMPYNDVTVTANWAVIVNPPTVTVTITATPPPSTVISTQTVTNTATTTAVSTTTATSATTSTATVISTTTANGTVTTTTTSTDTTTVTITSPPGGCGDGKWALLNLILAITGVLIGLATVVQATRKSEREENRTDRNTPATERKIEYNRRSLIWLLITVISATVGICFFFNTENMSNAMRFVDRWTIVNAVILVIVVICAILTFRRTKQESQNQTLREHND